jgi:serine/arginine repetitive matrix protein 2
MPEEDSAAAAADATADAASLGPRTASGSAPEDLASRSGGERPSEESVLAALASRDPERAPPDASDSDSEEGRKESKKHKKEKKSKKSKKHKKEKKSKKKRRRERGSGSSSSTSDSDDDGGGSSSKPVQLSAFMAGSKRTADDGERYSSVSGLKISNSYEMSEYDKSQAEKRERKLRKLNGGAEQDDFQHWGGDFKKAKVTDPAALALQQTLRGINKMGKAGAVLDQGLARSLDEKKKASAASRRR